MRWLYHALLAAEDVGDPYAPASLRAEGFVHASFAPALRQTLSLYFPPDAALTIFQIDPRRLPYAVAVVETPRGPMPHLPGAIPRHAIVARWSRGELPDGLPDALSG